MKKAVAKQSMRAGQARAGHEVLSDFRANEVFVAIVAPAGAGAGTAAKILHGLFEERGFQPTIVKVSKLIRATAEKRGLEVPPLEPRKSLEAADLLQDRGDEIRKGDEYGRDEDHAAVARLALEEIKRERARLQNEEYSGGEVKPDGNKRAFIIDSLRHPAEAALLREVYKDAFALLGVVCDPVKREERIRRNLFDRKLWDDPDVRRQVRDFLTRDENAAEKFGQHVSDTFHQSDFFVDNSKDAGDDLRKTGMNKQLARFADLVAHQKIIRPTISETAMHHARSAQMRSACLSRQVGAALVDRFGNIVATGTNDVPRAGGGLYGENFTLEQEKDERCAYRDTVFCSNNRLQNEIIEDLLGTLTESVKGFSQIPRPDMIKKLRATGLGGLIEFSRSVHAEMDAILSAAIAGASPRGCRMFVTTYPCHYCARHIIAAGIDEVQFIEPYPKSRAMELHSDSMTANPAEWIPPSEGGNHALFHPFVGVAPRLYRRVFLKDRNYKDDISGEFLPGQPIWGGPVEIYRESYTTMENELSLTDE